jgi:hypothetical protein
MNDLERDAAAFSRLLPGLLAEHAGEYVLIHAGEIAGTYPSHEAAIEAGYDRFELQPFFVERVALDATIAISLTSIDACRI